MIRNVLAVYFTCWLAIGGVIVPVRPAEAQEETVYTIAVLNLEAKGVSQVEAEVLSDKLRSHVNQISRSERYNAIPGVDRYEVVERQNMDKIFEEFNVQSTGCVSDSCLIEFGRILQADRILIGTVGKVGSTYSVSTRIIDVGSSRMIGSADLQHAGTIDDVLNTVIVQVGDKLFYGSAEDQAVTAPSRPETQAPQPDSGGTKKSKKKWYIIGALVVAGVGAGAALMGGGGGGGDGGTPTLDDLPLPPSRPE